MLKMVVKHCCYAQCTSDNRYLNKLPPGTCFLPFAKPGTIKDNMKEWEKRQQRSKTERAKHWIHACGRKHFTLVKQITKYSYICSLHFNDPSEENPDPIIATLFLFYKHMGKLGLSSICLRFSQFEPEIMLKVCLISKLISWSDIAFDMNTAMVSFKCSNLNIQLGLT